MDHASRSAVPRAASFPKLAVATEIIARGQVLPLPSVEARERSLRQAERKRLIAQLKRAIRRATTNAVREFEVLLENDTVRLTGHCTSFYCKQLAQQAAMQFLGELSLANEIEVLPPR